MTTEPPEIDYQCLSKGCPNTFKARQGSRRFFCDECQGKRAAAGLKKAIEARHKKGAGK